MEALLDEYGRILKELKFDSFNHNEDKYSVYSCLSHLMNTGALA